MPSFIILRDRPFGLAQKALRLGILLLHLGKFQQFFIVRILFIIHALHRVFQQILICFQFVLINQLRIFSVCDIRVISLLCLCP